MAGEIGGDKNPKSVSRCGKMAGGLLICAEEFLMFVSKLSNLMVDSDSIDENCFMSAASPVFSLLTDPTSIVPGLDPNDVLLEVELTSPSPPSITCSSEVKSES